MKWIVPVQILLKKNKSFGFTICTVKDNDDYDLNDNPARDENNEIAGGDWRLARDIVV